MQKYFTVGIMAAALAISAALPSFSQSDKGFEALITETDTSEFQVEGAESIDHIAALELYEQGALFVDVRAAWRYDQAHVRGAVGLELNNQFNEQSLAEHAAKDQTVVFYCNHSVCERSAIASAKALTWGYIEVKYFADGWSAWSGNGYEQD